jgi:RIO kinase 1
MMPAKRSRRNSLKQIDLYDDLEPSFEHRKHGTRQQRRAHRSKQDLYLEETQKESSESKFAHPDLQGLHLRGYVDEILAELKSGKEATVYLGINHLDDQQNLVAVKVYKDLEARSFKNDAIYREGRFIGSQRVEKAIAQRSKVGLAIQQNMWVYYEYMQLWQLYKAGVPVPRPLVGPDSKDIEQAGRVVLMEWIGDEEAAAPRLSEVKLSKEAAQDAFEQSVHWLKKILELGKVHGDYSTYNLLYWQDKVMVIDVPQMVNIEENPNAKELLERDVCSLCTSFRRLEVYVDSAKVITDVSRHYPGSK